MKNIVGPEAAGERGGLERYTKIMFGAGYIDGRPDPGTRIDPNNPQVSSGNQIWPNRRSHFAASRARALTPDGKKLYVALPAAKAIRLARRRRYTKTRKVTKWLDLRPPGMVGGLRPISVKMAPVNTMISPNPTRSCSTSTAISPPSSTPATTRAG